MATNPLTIFNQNFGIAERLLQVYQLANGLRPSELPSSLKQALCGFWGEPENAHIKYAVNDRVAILSRSAARFPDAHMEEGGLDFLLRQAVIMACTSLETFFWDVVCANALTLIRLRRSKAAQELKNLTLTLTLEEYVALEKYNDPEQRFNKILLKNFERKTLYDLKSIDQIANILAVRNFWDQVEKTCGEPASNLRRLIGDLIARRNLIAHRADRPTDGGAGGGGGEVDGHGLRPITFSWTHMRVQATKTLVSAAAVILTDSVNRLEQQHGANLDSSIIKGG